MNEIRFRLRQELSNLYLRAFPPCLPAKALKPGVAHMPAWPDPAETGDCLPLAEELLKHRFPLLGITLETGRDIRWRRDYGSGVETGAVYFRRIPYLDAARSGDHKTIWELNRHQHLVVLAQAYALSGRPEFCEEIIRQLEDWLAQNPFQRGINWASALEVAFRAISWIRVYSLMGERFGSTFRRRFLEGLYRHGRHLEVNLSYYFSPNTHLLGEAVVLHALGRLFPDFPHAKRWEETGARVVRQEIDRQVLADGCHFERSTYYHVYALDMFLFHAMLRGRSSLDDMYADQLSRMAVFLDAVMGPAGILPMFGDDDGGRWFHPYGPRDRFGLGTVAACSAFLDRPGWIRGTHRFWDSGLIVMAAGDIQAVVDTGPFGPGRAGHSHADTLSMVLRVGQEQILIDPGTYTYVADPVWRDRFRGTAAHNTIRIDGLDQAVPAGPFGWQSRPEVEVLEWESSPARDVLTAACSYAGFRHRRRIVFDKSELWIGINDRVEGGPGEHRIEQYWHLGVPARRISPSGFQVGEKAVIVFDPSIESRLFEGGDSGWVSPVFGLKLPAPVICVEQRATLPASLETFIDLSGNADQGKWNSG